MSSKLISAPSGEPVALADAKKHLRVDFADDDNLILGLITAARQQAETICRRAFVSQQWKVGLDQFPRPGMNIGSANWYGPQWGISPGPLTVLSPSGKTGYEIYLPLPPLVTVDSIQYIDVDGVTQTLDPALYIVDDLSEPARITPAYGANWPAARNVINSVIVTFTAGYGTATEVPQAIKQWMLLAIGAMYENRESDVVVSRGSMVTMPFADSLLQPYRCVSF